jgi:hypothetical protein
MGDLLVRRVALETLNCCIEAIRTVARAAATGFGGVPEDGENLVAESLLAVADGFEAAAVAGMIEDRIATGSFEPSVHVPGLWRCPRCEFLLMQSNLNAADGTVTARDEPGDKCPNDGSPMWRVTWREHSDEMLRVLEAELSGRALLKEAAERFREYEQGHRERQRGHQAPGHALPQFHEAEARRCGEKAARNGEIAARIEMFLLSVQKSLTPCG